MQNILRSVVLLSVVLALPIIPLVVWGELFGDVVTHWQQSPPPPAILALAVASLLASDIFLPIPSGPVATLAGARLGFPLGSFACWVGMMLGAVAAFALARRYGQPLAVRLASAADFQQMEASCRTHGVWMLLATRPLPVLAEACVLLVGVLGTPWWRFLAAVATANLALAVTYAALGHLSADQQWLPLAVCVSLAVPGMLAVLVRRRCASRRRAAADPSTESHCVPVE